MLAGIPGPGFLIFRAVRVIEVPKTPLEAIAVATGISMRYLRISIYRYSENRTVWYCTETVCPHMCQVNTHMEVMCMDPMTLPCADCGLLTGRFCDGGELDRTDHRIQIPGGQPCLAVHRVCEADGRHGELVALGHSDRVVPVGQRTPLCSTCCWASQVHTADGLTSPDLCHFCKGSSNPPPPMRGAIDSDMLASWAPR